MLINEGKLNTKIRTLKQKIKQGRGGKWKTGRNKTVSHESSRKGGLVPRWGISVWRLFQSKPSLWRAPNLTLVRNTSASNNSFFKVLTPSLVLRSKTTPKKIMSATELHDTVDGTKDKQPVIFAKSTRCKIKPQGYILDLLMLEASKELDCFLGQIWAFHIQVRNDGKGLLEVLLF